MTIKQLCRKRNKLVTLSSKLSGEQQKAVEFAIYLIDIYLDGDLDENATKQLKNIIEQLN
jgi:ubiquitin C-terminal hydrolase